MENPDNHEKSKNRDSLGRWVKGVSGNVLGRPKGKTMKEWAREYLSRLTDEERDEFMEGMPKEKIWSMAEGNPEQAQTLEGSVEVKIINYGHLNNSTQLSTEGISKETTGSTAEIQNSGVSSSSGQE